MLTFPMFIIIFVIIDLMAETLLASPLKIGYGISIPEISPNTGLFLVFFSTMSIIFAILRNGNKKEV